MNSNISRFDGDHPGAGPRYAPTSTPLTTPCGVAPPCAHKSALRRPALPGAPIAALSDASNYRI
ncbi:MAG TPA: hypothetical protein PK238_12265 [Giesbergeria sp.]|nr:hypothetical protein [Giesbergeria sp.]